MIPNITASEFAPTWFRPWMIWAAAVVALVALLEVKTVRLADAKADVAAEAGAHAETKRLYAVTLAAAISDARKTENELRASLERVQDQAAKEKADAKAREDALVDRVRTGERRLSVAAVCPGGGGTGLRPGTAGSGGSSVSRAELDPAAAERILRIGFDADQAIRERNACIAAYEAVRSRLNALSKDAGGDAVHSGAP